MSGCRARLAFWQPECSNATCAGVFAGACPDCGPALRYSAGPRMARIPGCRRERPLRHPGPRDAHRHQCLRTWHGGPTRGHAAQGRHQVLSNGTGQRADRQRTGGIGNGASAAHRRDQPMRKTCTIFSWRSEALEACSVRELTTRLPAPGCSLQGSNVRHERRPQAGAAGWRASARWRG